MLNHYCLQMFDVQVVTNSRWLGDGSDCTLICFQTVGVQYIESGSGRGTMKLKCILNIRSMMYSKRQELMESHL